MLQRWHQHYFSSIAGCLRFFKVLIPGVIDSDGLFEYRTKKDFEALISFFSDSDSHPRRSADGKPHINAETKEMIANMSEQLKTFEEMFQESW
jgi:hypothetical protein